MRCWSGTSDSTTPRSLHECAETASQRHVIAAVQAIRGIGFLTAVTIVAEAGDLRRFASAPQFMAYVGLVPAEHSSGGSHHRGSITRTGNSLLRHVLGEAAHHARHVPRVQGALKQRQASLPPPVVALAWRTQLRLHARYRHLAGRIGPHKALTAVATRTGWLRLGAQPTTQRGGSGRA